MNDLRDTDVLILGLGATGLAMARWCARHGARVRAWDSRDNPPQAAALAAELPGSVRITGPLRAAALERVSRVFKSPGLAPSDPQLAELYAAARAAGVPVQGELELFAQALAALRAQRRYMPRVLAITGTNGKTTTTALTGRLVARAGRRVAVAGNIGPSMLDTLAAALDAQAAADAEVLATLAEEGEDTGPDTVQEIELDLEPADELLAPTPMDAADDVDLPLNDTLADPFEDTVADGDPAFANTSGTPLAGPSAAARARAIAGSDDDELPRPARPAPPPAAPVFSHLPEVWVLELSSFQLDGVEGFEPTAATVLNVTQDHLDWHGGMVAYAAAKARVFGREARMVINRDDPRVEAMVPPPVLVKAGPRMARPKLVARQVTRFGLDAPQAPGDFGLLTVNGMTWLVRALERDETIRLRKGEEAAEELHVQRLMPADALRIRGRHNAANALAALALASAAGCPLAPLLHGLRDYRGEPHRVESLGQVGDIEFFDDSKGTNVGATAAALEGLGRDRAPARLVLILGGDGKGQDFTPLLDGLRRHARAAATIGRDAAAIEAVLQAAGVPFARHRTLEEATRWCLGRAERGDAVLLSPACASLDMFHDYAHRARVFAATFAELVEERGGVAA